MFYISKEVEISAAHYLNLPYDSPCNNLHGHNWKIKVFFKAKELNKDEMIIDFTRVKALIKGKYDHKKLNQLRPFCDGINSTAERLAYEIQRYFLEDGCYRVEVQEVEGSWAAYEEDE